MASTVIIGAGIIGCSTAFYLSESTNTKARDIHLIEASPTLFASASGYAGGFLAKDWFAPTVAPLGALSFKLHSELAQKYDGRSKWGYSKSTGNSLTSDDSAVGASGEDWLRDGSSRAQTAGKHEFHEGDGPAWLTRHQGSSLEVISRDDSTAQVEPLKLSQFLLDTCLERGVNLHQPAQALSVSKDARDELASIRIVADDGTETDIPCTRLIFTAGAWTPRVFSTLFPSSTTSIPISQLAGHSLVLRSPRWSREHEDGGCHAIFATEEKGFSPEMFSRMGGEIYIAGLNSSDIPLPDKATDATPTPAALERLRLVATKMLGLPGAEKDDLEVLREGLCFRPVTSSGRPIVSRIADERLGEGWKTRGGGEGGVFVAGGHGPWGISMSLGTGKVLSEMVEGKGKGEMSANVRSLALS